MSVEVVNLTKIFGKQKAVDNISFIAEKGKITGFIGPNGAGKSTTMKIITGYTSPTEGYVNVCGEKMYPQNIKLKAKIGYLPELNPLYYDMFVREYLRFTGEIYGIYGKKLKEAIEKVIADTGLTIESNKKIGQLSKGYKQRVGLAAALIHNPEVLILDEPTTGLDPNQIIEIRSLIKSVSQDKTVILSSHIMQEVQALCDKIVIIKKGTIVANDQVETLVSENQNSVFKTVLKTAKSIDIFDFKSKIEIKDIEEVKTNEYKISSDKDVRQDIISYVIAHQLELLEIKQEELNMENIFIKLTK
jgi:ABC-2 type transport system ATP-binding protein